MNQFQRSSSAFLSTLLIACSEQVPEPKTYEDCILQKVKPGMDMVAIGTVAGACRGKFPKPLVTDFVPDQIELPPQALEKLSAKGYFSSGRFSLRGSIYNGNPDWDVTEVTIDLVANAQPSTRQEPETQKYRVAVSVPAYSSKEFSVSVSWDSGEPWWTIGEAKGFRK
jgi:hypothetical protein